MVLQGYLSDRYGKRHWHIQAGAAWTLLWYVLLVAVNHGDVPVALLFVCVYMVVPVLGISPIMMAWNNEIHQCDSGMCHCVMWMMDAESLILLLFQKHVPWLLPWLILSVTLLPTLLMSLPGQ